MAIESLLFSQLTFNSVDMTDHCSNIELNIENAENDITNFDSGGGRDFVKGLETSTLSFSLFNDYAASSINATMSAAVGTKVAFMCSPGTGAASATNPHYSGTVYVNSWSPIMGSPGDPQNVSLSFPCVGTVTMATA